MIRTAKQIVGIITLLIVLLYVPVFTEKILLRNQTTPEISTYAAYTIQNNTNSSNQISSIPTPKKLSSSDILNILAKYVIFPLLIISIISFIKYKVQKK